MFPSKITKQTLAKMEREGWKPASLAEAQEGRERIRAKFPETFKHWPRKPEDESLHPVYTVFRRCYTYVLDRGKGKLQGGVPTPSRVESLKKNGTPVMRKRDNGRKPAAKSVTVKPAAKKPAAKKPTGKTLAKKNAGSSLQPSAKQTKQEAARVLRALHAKENVAK